MNAIPFFVQVINLMVTQKDPRHQIHMNHPPHHLILRQFYLEGNIIQLPPQGQEYLFCPPTFYFIFYQCILIWWF